VQQNYSKNHIVYMLIKAFYALKGKHMYRPLMLAFTLALFIVGSELGAAAVQSPSATLDWAPGPFTKYASNPIRKAATRSELRIQRGKRFDPPAPL